MTEEQLRPTGGIDAPSEPKYAPIGAPLPPTIPAAPTIHAPSIFRRIAAIPYEGMLLLALVLIAGFPIAGVKPGTLEGATLIAFQLYLFVVTASYFVWQWQKSGQTLAMKTWRFRLVDEHGGGVFWRRALLRFVCALLFFGPACAGSVLLFFPDRISPSISIWFFLPLLATLLYARFDADKQFLHDRLSGTMLVDASITRIT